MKRLMLFTGFALLLFVSACSNSRTSPGVSAASPDEVRISAAGIEASEPAMAVDAAGNAFVVYVEHTGKDSADVYLQKVGADGKAVNTKVRVNEKPGEAKAWFGDPPTIVAAGGNVYVGWTARDGEKGTTLYLSVSRNGGDSFDPPVKVNDDKVPASHGMHSLAVGADGKVYMAWLDERYLKHSSEHAADTTFDQVVPVADGYHFEKAYFHESHPTPKKNTAEKKIEMGDEPNAELYFAVSTDGGKTFSANKKLTADVCPCCKTSMAAAPDGRMYVAWRQVLANGCRHISVMSSADAGATFSEPRIVSDDNWLISACPVSGAALSAESGGSLKVAWYTAGSAGQAGVYSATSTDAGASFSPRLMISNEATGGTPTMLNAGGREYSVFSNVETVLIKMPDGKTQTIANAAKPSAAVVNGKVMIAFVRSDADKKNVQVAMFDGK